MKYLIFFLFFLTLSTNAQWTDNGANLTTTDNVGIGTTNPQTRLDVSGGNIRLSGGKVTQSGDIANDNNAIFINTATNGYGIYSKGGLGNRYAFHFENQAGESIILGRGNGNIGIGRIDPQTRLDVSGGNIRLSGGKVTQSGDIANDNNAIFINTATNGYGIYSKGGLGNRYAFHFENQAGESIILGRGNGNIGIGTTSPDAKLAVNGNIHTKEVKVDLVGWPDHVFEKSYNLPTLEQVENHIKEKGHLKDIPSAKEVEKDGILLGEMDSKLLQKIEELMLYTIQQQKEIKELKSRLGKLESK